MKHSFVALLLGALTVIVLTATAPDIGLTWDEPAYMVPAERHVTWLQELVTNPAKALSVGQIRQYWTPDDGHPPLDKIWSGVVWAGARYLFDDLTAHRLGNIILAGIMVGVLYKWMADAYGAGAGLAAAGALMVMPRFFFHAHLAALDVPIAVGIFCVTALFWKTVGAASWKYDLALGIAWGAALAIKLNAFFLPPTLLLWIIILRRRFYLLRRLVVMTVVGIPVACLTWPWLYFNTFKHIGDYIQFITQHYPIGQWYFGKFYMPPPWHYVFVIVWAVVPLTLTALYFLGSLRASRERKKDGGLGWLLIISAVAPLVVLASGKSWVYDGERLFMPTFPFLAALAGMGFGWIADGIRKLAGRLQGSARLQRLQRVPWTASLASVASLVVFLPPLLSIHSFYPHLLSYYSENIGGLPNATRLGLETTYWCETFATALPYLNKNAKPGEVVWVEPWSFDTLIYYQLHGRLRPDVYITFPPYYYAKSVFQGAPINRSTVSYEAADFVVFQYRQSYYGGLTDPIHFPPDWLNSRSPALRLSAQGIPLMDVYVNKQK